MAMRQNKTDTYFQVLACFVVQIYQHAPEISSSFSIRKKILSLCWYQVKSRTCQSLGPLTALLELEKKFINKNKLQRIFK